MVGFTFHLCAQIFEQDFLFARNSAKICTKFSGRCAKLGTKVVNPKHAFFSLNSFLGTAPRYFKFVPCSIIPSTTHREIPELDIPPAPYKWNKKLSYKILIYKNIFNTRLFPLSPLKKPKKLTKSWMGKPVYTSS